MILSVNTNYFLEQIGLCSGEKKVRIEFLNIIKTNFKFKGLHLEGLCKDRTKNTKMSDRTTGLRAEI
jgi:hypothetical protein